MTEINEGNPELVVAGISISVVVPCYRAESHIVAVVTEMVEVLEPVFAQQFEIILVDDASKDDTFGRIRELGARFCQVRGIQLAVNAGQGGATVVGLKAARGDVIVYVDDDGEAPFPEVIQLYKAISNGSDIAVASYEKPRQFGIRKVGSSINAWLVQRLNPRQPKMALANFWAVSDTVARYMAAYPGPAPFLDQLLLHSSSHIETISVKPRFTLSTKSRYSIGALVSLQLSGVASMSLLPLRLAFGAGVLMLCVGLVFAGVAIAARVSGASTQSGFAALVALQVALMGSQFVFLGVLGEYVGRIFQTIMGSGVRVIRDTVN